MVSSYRKRKYEEMENDGRNEEFKHLKEQTLNKLKNKDLKEKIIEFEDIALDHAENLGKLHHLYELGVIRKDWEYIQPENE